MTRSVRHLLPAPVRRFGRNLLEQAYGEVMRLRHRDASPGTAEWLIKGELLYGGFVSRVKRRKVSPNDHRSPAEIRQGGMTGGDRMSPLHNNYARVYARHLSPFVDRQKPVLLCEVGILRGTGLAMWSELFPNGTVVGLDVDLSHVEENMPFLRSRGAFRNANVECFPFDQLADGAERFAKILSGRTIDILIDDGLHSDQAILTTIAAAVSHLADDFLYIVEDNAHVHHEIRRRYPAFRVVDYDVKGPGSITVITPGVDGSTRNES
jgi:hypothetical protein